MAKCLITNLRHEIKILINYADYIALANKLSMVCEKDPFTQENGDYFIRSLYLDDIYNSSYNEKISGTDKRHKYRIRIYNYSDSVIKLEKKEKFGSRIKKTSFPITREMYDDFMADKPETLLSTDEPLAKEVYTMIKSEKLEPSVIVDYDREAYVHPLSNTRLTFDKALHSGITDFDIFNKDITTMAVFPEGSVIFEVKYDDYLPAHLAAIISTVQGYKISLSKFCMCRNKLNELNISLLKSNLHTK